MNDAEDLRDMRISFELLLKRLTKQSKLKSREIEILRRRMKGETLAEVGAVFKINAAYVRQLEARAIRIMSFAVEQGVTASLSAWELAQRVADIVELQREREAVRQAKEAAYAEGLAAAEAEDADRREKFARAKAEKEAADNAWRAALKPCPIGPTGTRLKLFVYDTNGALQEFTHWHGRIAHVELMNAIGDNSFYTIGKPRVWATSDDRLYDQCTWFCSANREGKCGRSIGGNEIPIMCASGRVKAL